MFTRIEISHCCAASGVAFRIHTFQHTLKLGNGSWFLGTEGGREPSLDYRGRDNSHAFLAHGIDSLVPTLVCSNFRRGIGEDQFLQPSRRISPQPHARLSSDRQSAEIDLVEMEKV